MNRQNEVKDIVPDLLNKIESTYKDLVENDEVLSSLLKKNADKLAKAQDEQDFAAKIAERLSEAYKEHISSGNLPNGQMYYNIAKRIIPPTMTDSYQQISDYCYAAQSALNENAGITIKAQRAPINTDRIDGIVNRVSQEPFDEIDWILKAPIENFCRSVVDDHKKANADFHYRSGLRPRIIRKTDGKCCKWCSNIAGTYEYSPGMDREVFRRHENCGCTVEYDPGDGSKRRQNVWDKSWSNDLVSEKKPVVTGARILDPDTKEAWEWAKVQYEEIRHRTTDCMKIANKYGYKVEDIERIKDYLFLSGKYYDSLEDIWRPFEPDAAIAQSWNRLSNDKSCLPHDLTLLNHELMEMKIKDENPSIDHLEAHRRTELLYNYVKESKEYYANRRKRYEKRR